ncbi:MAG TPA: ion channel [Polyangia bacterium]|nr:ion channel [Polyangia bacterium]
MTTAETRPRPSPPGLPFAVERIGYRHQPLGDLYHFLLTTSWRQLIGAIVVGYVATNLVFALLYWWPGNAIENARPGSFSDAFFFSVQTMATIGYGKMAPATLYGHVLVTVEALSGLLGFAMATGLIFAKFSRPTARVLFSRVAVISRRDGVQSLMFRVANARRNQIVDAHLRLSMLRDETTPEGEAIRRFHDLHLQRSSAAFFAITWTAVHRIEEHSPLYGQTAESLAASKTQVIVSLLGVDETLSQTVHARYNYDHSDLRWGARFVDILSRSSEGRLTVNYGRFHDCEPAAE